MNSALTLSDIFQQFIPAYKKRYPLSPDQSKVVGAINSCRTSALGGRLLVCGHCHYEQTQYHSCRNRHCPRCQYQASEQWRDKRSEDILPVPYFHLVFTLPHELNGWVQLHPRVVYRLLFSAVWDTLRCFGQDPKRLHGDIGMTAVLHTWGQNLNRHVHLHCLIPGGALSMDKGSWTTVKSPYLFPVRALSRSFRGKMVAGLRGAYNAGELDRIESGKHVDEVLDRLMSKQWVVYSRHTCQQAMAVVDYLSQYTYRIAINHQRLESMDHERVQFRWKDYADNGVRKTQSLTGVEFIRRFLLHVLPHGFMRIRHFGVLANCHRKARLVLIRRLLSVAVIPELARPGSDNTLSVFLPVREIVAGRCPQCH